MIHSQATKLMWMGRTFKSEGVYSFDYDDRGNWTSGIVGKGILKGTKYGIAAHTHPTLDIKNLTKADAISIYNKEYLEPIGVDDFRDGVAYQLFDFGVNSGPYRAKKDVQTAVGVVSDGIIGPITLKAMRALKEHQLIMRLISQRMRFQAMRAKFKLYGKGWTIRNAENLIYGAKDS